MLKLIPLLISLSLAGKPFESSFTIGVSYYGAICAPSTQLDQDFERLKSLSLLGPHRVWVNWTRGPSNCGSAIDSNGNLIPSKRDALRHVLQKAKDLGMTIDLTFSPTNVVGKNLSKLKLAIQNTVREFKSFDNWLIDVSNEAESTWSPTDIAQLVRAVKEIDSARVVTVSYSGPDIAKTASRYASVIKAGGNLTVLAPHFDRSKDWATALPSRMLTLGDKVSENGVSAPPIYLQEEARNGYNGSQWQVSDFITSARNGRDYQAKAWVFHTDAGFDPTLGSFFSQLDSVESQVVNQLGALVAPIPPDTGRYDPCEPTHKANPEVAQIVDRLFKSILNRLPDSKGACAFYTFIKAHERQGILESSRSMILSNEFTSKYRPSDAEALLDRLYQLLLLRSKNAQGHYYDQAGGNAYLPILRGPFEGFVRVTDSVLNSSEFSRVNTGPYAKPVNALPPVPPPSDGTLPKVPGKVCGPTNQKSTPPGCIKFARNGSEFCDDDVDFDNIVSRGGEYTFHLGVNGGGRFFLTPSTEMLNGRCQNFGKFDPTKPPFKATGFFSPSDDKTTYRVPPSGSVKYTLGSFGGNGNQGYLCPCN